MVIQEPVVLYVEDDPYNREVMSMIFEFRLQIPHFYMMDSTHHFMERLRALPKKPNLILLDIHLQPIDGFEVLQMIRRDPDFGFGVMVVAVTASVTNEEVGAMTAAHFDGGIAKPINLDMIAGLLQRIMQGESVWYVA